MSALDPSFPFVNARERMVEQLQDRGIRDIRVLTALRLVPRHLFVDEALRWRAYDDDALPIEEGQTISQPYVVARMTELLMPVQPKKVLEVGTGSGYQAVVLAQLVEELYSVERIRSLHFKARGLMRKLSLEHVHCIYSDGFWGYPEQAEYDAIMVTAAPEEVPDELLGQLKIGGRLVTPVGKTGEVQKLLCIDRTADGFESEVVDQVHFVPMLGGKN